MRAVAVVRGERLDEWSGHGLALALALADEVVAVAFGPGEGALRRALSLGASAAVRVDGAGADDPLGEARALADAVRTRAAALVLAGADTPTGAGLAGLLDVPIVPAVRSAERTPSALRVRRELSGGRVETVDVDLPAVLTAAFTSTPLRTPSFRQIKEAEREEISVERADVTRVAYRIDGSLPPARRARPLPGDPAAAAAAILAIVRERLA